jgi:nitric oxide reductase NorD protein
VREARAKGQAVFAVTVDRRAEGYVPYLFGRGGYAILAHLGRLPEALPAIYRQLVS